jgi:uncharacterized protein (DUF488 family)
MQQLVLTVGHGARTIDQLVAVLHDGGIGRVADVRRYPGSRRHPQFGREALEVSMSGAGIAYEWHGDALGGRRTRLPASRHTALRVPAFAGYADHMDGADFRAAVDGLVARARADQIAIMCAETVWWQCHRMLVADALTLRGAQVVHLLDVGRRQPHRPHPTLRRDDAGWPVYDVADTLPGLG